MTLIERLRAQAEEDRLYPETVSYAELEEEAVDELERKDARIERLEKINWLCARDWVFWSTYNPKTIEHDDGAYPCLLINDVFVRGADAYEFSLDDVDEIYDAAKAKGYDGLIEYVSAKTGWKALTEDKP